MDLKKKIYSNIKKKDTNIKSEHLYRKRIIFDPENPIFKDLVNHKFISSVAKGFYNSSYINFMKLTYELKKGIGEFDLNRINDKHREYHYHSDRLFGWIKFCLFLEDIEENNGPFCIIPGSQNWPKSILDFKHRIKTFYNNNYSSTLPTFNKDKLKKYFNTENEIKLTGKKGDLMVVNTAAYHKGANVKKNFTREVLWFYTKFPSSFETFTGKIKNSIIKKNFIF